MKTVLNLNFKVSTNFFKSDAILNHYLQNNLSARGLAYIFDKLETLGALAATELTELSKTADKYSPILQKRNFYGENVDQINFHPAYKRMKEIAIQSEMLRIKWEPELRQRFAGDRHKMGFSAGFLFAMSESGLYCPLCMTDGAALLIDEYCDESDKNRLMPHIYTQDVEEFYTGAMFLTEKNAGSDVGSINTLATHYKSNIWKLNGEKWFCSNASAEIIFALARTNTDIQGTKGLGIFLLEPHLLDGSKNGYEIVRLKEKLGTRSMASAEILLKDAQAILVGEERGGFKIMTDMINLSRLYNSVAAVSASRRALVETYQFLSFRSAFGKNVLEHSLVRLKLFELGAICLGNFYALWTTIELLDNSEVEDFDSKELLRILTPLLKKSTAEQAVYIIREAMELMGGIGYIEDGVIPKLFRDVLVLPIWEGTGNVMILDMLRAVQKSDGLNVLVNKMLNTFRKKQDKNPDNAYIWDNLQHRIYNLKKDWNIIQNATGDIKELKAKYFFEELTNYYQLFCILKNYDEHSKEWIDISLNFYFDKLNLNDKKNTEYVPNSAEIQKLISWDF
jgi:acyl-CoA dehydrogenase